MEDDVDIDALAVGLRELERMLIVGGGIVAVVLGYRLFINLPMLEADGTGKIQLPGGVSIFLSRIGPGIFFALFGSAVLSLALKEVIFARETAPATAASSPGATHGAAQRVYYSGAGPTTTVGLDQRQAERNNAVGTISQLKTVQDTVEVTLKGVAKDDAMTALEDAQVRIMRTVWDEDAWGPLGDFEQWRKAGMPQPAPKNIARAAALLARTQR